MVRESQVYSFRYISNKMQHYTVEYISGKVFYVFWVVSPLIIRSTHNCIYSIWYLSNRYCHLPTVVEELELV